MLSILTRNSLRYLTKNRNRSGNVVEDIRSRGGTYKVLQNKRTQVSPVIAIDTIKKTVIIIT